MLFSPWRVLVSFYVSMVSSGILKVDEKEFSGALSRARRLLVWEERCREQVAAEMSETTANRRCLSPVCLPKVSE